MSFEIPTSALRQGAGQMRMDGTVEGFDPHTPPSMREVFLEPSKAGEAGVIADLNVLARAGQGKWLKP